MSKLNEMKSKAAPEGAERTASPESDSDATKNHGAKPAHEVQVHVDYISADGPTHRKFPPDASLAAVKLWAREHFIPKPPSEKMYYLNDDKTRHRFTADEEQRTLAQLGYEHVAHFRLNEEQAAGGPDVRD